MTGTSTNKMNYFLSFIAIKLRTNPLITIATAITISVLIALIVMRVTVIASRASANSADIDISKALAVNTVIVNAETDYTTRQKIAGQVIASRESDHGFDRAGILAEVFVDEGDRVKKGDILAKLDMRLLQAREMEVIASLDKAVAMAAEAKATLDRVSANYDRYVVLRESGHISQARFDQVKNDLESAKAGEISAKSNIEGARAALASLKADRDLSVLRARFDGSVIARYRDEGEAFGMSGGAMVRLIEDSKLEIRVGLTQSAARALKIGNSYNFSQSNREIKTVLRSIVSKVDQNTRTVTAIFDITEGMGVLPGSLAEMSIDVEVVDNGYWLPTEALAESRRGLWSAYTLSPLEGYDDIATTNRQELQVVYTEADRVFVRGTLKDGDRVVSSGTHRLSQGFLVKAN